MRTLALALVCFSAAGCASLNSVQKAELRAMKLSDTNVYVEEKNTDTATALGFLPGVGSFYTRQYALGVVDLLLWPVSMIWDPIAGYQGAQTINYTVSKQRAKRMRTEELAELESQLSSKAIDESEYQRREKKVMLKYTFE